MPKMGEAHKLLSPTHPDTEPPAAGADPADGQVATWSAALEAWTAQDPAAGGVSDHGLLDGLADDDHSIYALADKSRPSPWVAAADLYFRDIHDFANRHHHDLQFLDADDHQQYLLYQGRPGGPTIHGSPNPSEHLTLQSTTHATRGYVRAQDDLQLLSNILRDSGGNNRLQLATASPHAYLRDEVRIGTRLGLGANPAANTGFVCSPALSAALDMKIADFTATAALTGGSRSIKALMGQGTAIISAGATASMMAGLYFTALAAGAGDVTELYAAWMRAGLFNYSGAAPTVWGLKLRSPQFMFATYPSTAYGLEIEDQGGNAGATHDAVGLKIADQTTTTGVKRLIEAGPATPYLRLLGGADPAANVSNLLLKLGATLKLVSEYDADSAGVGYRALRVPN